MNSIRVLLVDDEPAALKRVRQLLARHRLIDIAGEATHVGQAKAILETTKVDAVFLDITMPGGTGFDLAESIPEDVAIVFVTAHAEFAVRAFRVPALDYLLKPIDPDRLDVCVERLKLRRVAGAFMLRSGKAELRVLAEDIAAVISEGAYVKFLFRNGKSLMCIGSIAQWTEDLEPYGFVRIDRSNLINPVAVVATNRLDRNRIAITLDGVASQVFAGRTGAVRLGRVKKL